MTPRRLPDKCFFFMITEEYVFVIKTRGDWVIRGLFYFYVKCPLRGKTYTVWDQKDIEDSVEPFMKGVGGCCIKVIIYLPLTRRGHRPKKLIKLYKTVKQTSVCNFFIWWSIWSISGEAFQHFCWAFQVPEIGACGLDYKCLPVKWQDIWKVYLKNKCVIQNRK